MANLDQQAFLELQADAESDYWEAEAHEAVAPNLQAVSVSLPALVGPTFWGWYDQHEGQVVVRKSVLGFPIKVRVKHLRRFFEQIFGAHP